jgi:hypothetical protein
MKVPRVTSSAQISVSIVTTTLLWNPSRFLGHCEERSDEAILVLPFVTKIASARWAAQ